MTTIISLRNTQPLILKIKHIILKMLISFKKKGVSMNGHHFNIKVIKNYTNLPLLVLQGKLLHLETTIFHSSHLLTTDNGINLTCRKNFKVSLIEFFMLNNAVL